MNISKEEFYNIKLKETCLISYNKTDEYGAFLEKNKINTIFDLYDFTKNINNNGENLKYLNTNIGLLNLLYFKYTGNINNAGNINIKMIEVLDKEFELFNKNLPVDETIEDFLDMKYLGLTFTDAYSIYAFREKGKKCIDCIREVASYPNLLTNSLYNILSLIINFYDTYYEKINEKKK